VNGSVEVVVIGLVVVGVVVVAGDVAVGVEVVLFEQFCGLYVEQDDEEAKAELDMAPSITATTAQRSAIRFMHTSRWLSLPVALCKPATRHAILQQRGGEVGPGPVMSHSTAPHAETNAGSGQPSSRF
jgi:hypothetical protein